MMFMKFSSGPEVVTCDSEMVTNGTAMGSYVKIIDTDCKEKSERGLCNGLSMVVKTELPTCDL